MPAATADQTPGVKRTAESVAKTSGGNIAGKTFLITGAYAGLGAETTRVLLMEGANVIVAGRNSKLQDPFVAKMAEEFGADSVDGGALVDLADLASVKQFASYVNGKYESIDVLILNAGIMATPPGVTKDGFESQMGVNVIGHFLLAKLLVEKTKRQVWLSSCAHLWCAGARLDLDYHKAFSMDNTTGYKSIKAYQQSKLGNVLLAKEFQKRYQPKLEAASLHPGVISTELGRHMGFSQLIEMTSAAGGMVKMAKMMFSHTKSVPQGAATTVTVASLTSEDLVKGGYYEDCEIAEESEAAKSEADAKALFDYCDEVTATFQ